MKLKTRILTAMLGAAALFTAAPAFAAFNYAVTYTDASGSATYPSTTQTITTTSATTFFTLSPGGSTTGSNTPTTVGLFSLTPQSTALSGMGPFAVNESDFTTTFSLQTVTNLDGSGPIGAPATFVVTGVISGTLGPDSDNTSIGSLVGLPTSVVAGGITYDITLDSVRSPGVIATEGNAGGVSLHIVAVPEPASISLLGLGAVSLLGRRRSTNVV
jgi:PEP-CTERM motif